MMNLSFAFQGTKGVGNVEVYIDEGAATVEVIRSPSRRLIS